MSTEVAILKFLSTFITMTFFYLVLQGVENSWAIALVLTIPFPLSLFIIWNPQRRYYGTQKYNKTTSSDKKFG